MGWTVHRVSIAVAVKAPTVEKLEERVQEVLGVLRRNQVMARRADAHQEEVYRKFFTADPAFDDAVIDDGYHSMVSKGPAMLAPYGHYVRDKFEGVMFGIARSGYPVFVDRWGLQSYNQVVTGKTGSGKTFAVMDHALRGTLMADEQWVIIDPQGNAGQMTKALSGSYNRLSLTEGTSINVLDVVEETLAAQNSYVLSLLETLWGEELSMQQKGVLDDALTAIYAQLDDDTRPEDMPTLETLIEMVEGDLPDFAAGMHRSVRGSLAGIFNRPTNIDLQMEAPIITYDLQDIPDEFEHLFTYMLLRSIERWLRRRRRRRRVGIIVDELGVLCRLHPAIQSAVTVLFKRIRNYNAGVVAMDQNITTFAEMPDVLENAKVKIFFGAETETEADRIQQMFRLTDYYRNVLLNAQRGEGVLLLGRREMHHIHVVPTGREFQLLARQPKGDEWVLWG
jgi:type IV secretory pathway VirB4 component